MRVFNLLSVWSFLLLFFLNACSTHINKTNEPLSLTATVHKTTPEGVGEYIGIIKFEDTSQGLVITPHLSNLSPGKHGFHIHEYGKCGASLDGTPGGSAGGHYDPAETKTHKGPLSHEGHKGDMPALLVNPQGTATTKMSAPHLKVKDIMSRSIMIHEGGDNYSDSPKPMGGGGARIACGIIPG